jgi:hypothetical protein
MATKITADQLPAPKVKPTFLTVPLEIRLEIYNYLPIEAMLPLRPPATPFSLPAYKHKVPPASNIAVLRTCKQVLFEATPIFYRSVYLGSASTIFDTDLRRFRPLIRASIKEITFDIPDEPSRFRIWLTYIGRPFPNLRHCKLFLRSVILGYWPPTQMKIEVVRNHLNNIQEGLFFTNRKR